MEFESKKQQHTFQQLLIYNAIFKENNDIYRNTAKALGLSESAFWILYTIQEMDDVITQSEICDMQFLPKQTINSALKKLEAEGYLNLVFTGNRKSKQIILTTKGKELVDNTINAVILAELRAWETLSIEEQNLFLQLFRNYTDALREQMDSLCRKDTIL